MDPKPHHEQNITHHVARFPPANFLSLPAELRQEILLSQTPFPSQTSHERFGVLMRFGILQRVDATRQKNRALMKVHPDMVDDVLYQDKKEMEAFEQECKETYGISMEGLLHRVIFWNPYNYSNRVSLRSEFAWLRGSYPAFSDELKYLEERSIFELLQSRSYNVRSDVLLTVELGQKERQMREAFDECSDMVGIDKRGKRIRMILCFIPIHIAAHILGYLLVSGSVFAIGLTSLYLSETFRACTE